MAKAAERAETEMDTRGPSYQSQTPASNPRLGPSAPPAAPAVPFAGRSSDDMEAAEALLLLREQYGAKRHSSLVELSRDDVEAAEILVLWREQYRGERNSPPPYGLLPPRENPVYIAVCPGDTPEILGERMRGHPQGTCFAAFDYQEPQPKEEGDNQKAQTRRRTSDRSNRGQNGFRERLIEQEGDANNKKANKRKATGTPKSSANGTKKQKNGPT